MVDLFGSKGDLIFIMLSIFSLGLRGILRLNPWLPMKQIRIQEYQKNNFLL